MPKLRIRNVVLHVFVLLLTNCAGRLVVPSKDDWFWQKYGAKKFRYKINPSKNTSRTVDPGSLCLKKTVLSIQDPVASKHGTEKGWMTQEDWGAELRKVDAAEHQYVKIGIDGFPCARQGCCQHNMTIRLGGSDWFVVQNVINEYAGLLKMLLPWKPRTILEGGGNIGVATSLFAFMYPDAKIISLEPEPDNCKLLQENTKGFKNVEIACIGLWDKEDVSVRLFRGGDGSPWAWRLAEVESGTPGALKTTSVTALLDKYGLDGFDMIKVDIEGAEFNVFGPGSRQQWLSRTAVMMLELHWQYGNTDDIRQQFKSAGFINSKRGEYDIFLRPSLQPQK